MISQRITGARARRTWFQFLSRRRFHLLLLLVPLHAPAARGSDVITIEAETGTLVNTRNARLAPGFSGAGYVTEFRSSNDLVRLSFNSPAACPGHLLVRYRSPFGQKHFDGSLNGIAFSGEFPGATAFTIFDAGSMRLMAGTNTLEIGGGSGGFDIDRVDLYLFPPPLPVPARLADAQATDATRDLMQKLTEDYGRHTWSGQHEAKDIAFLERTTGRRPLLVEGDLTDYSPSRVAHGSMPAHYTENLIALAQQGHVIALCWHWNAPAHLLDTADQPWWKGFYTQATSFDVEQALANTNSAEFALILSDIDAIAVQLRKFSDANIPVLWRPLHEAEGGFFWWGAKGREPFKQLWRLLFDRLTVHHGLHNLIWVHSSDRPDASWYPGNDVVDLVGLDGYPKDRNDTLKPRWEELKSRFDGKKAIALTEFGGVPDIEQMQDHGVWWSWFASWTGEFGPYGPSSSPTNRVMQTYQLPGVVTLPAANPIR